MLQKTSLILVLSLPILACESTQQSVDLPNPTSDGLVAAGYFEVSYDGRVYVLGSEASAAAFRKTHHLPLTKTLIGEGPAGETLVFEESADDPTTARRLIDEYRRRNLFYAVEKRDGRLYVLGSEASLESFRSNGHLPYTLTKIGDGPSGETVVVEVDLDNAHLATRLWDRFKAEELYYSEVNHEGRLYIVGDPATRKSIETHGHMPYAKTFIGGGPGGQTLVFEVDPKNEHLQERLIREFESRYGVSLR